MTLRQWLVGLYPPAWRAEYGEEFAELLEQSLHSPLDILDIVLGALDAHLQSGAHNNWRSMNMDNKLRTAILLVFAAYISFVVAGLGVYGFADDSPFVPMMHSNRAMFAAWTAIQIGALVGLAAVVVGGAPLAWTILHRALTRRRADLPYLLVPPVAFAVLILYLAALLFLTSRGLTIAAAPPAAHALLWGLVAVFVLGAVASTAAVWKVVSNHDAVQGVLSLPGGPKIRVLDFAIWPAIVATAAMLLILVGSVVWFWLALSARPDILAGNQGPIMMNSKLALVAILVIMLGALAAAFTGLSRVRTARQSLPVQ